MINISKEDLLIAKWCYSKGLYSSSIYHLQQATEKISKAFGLYIGILSKDELKSINHISPKVSLKILDHPLIKIAIGWSDKYKSLRNSLYKIIKNKEINQLQRLSSGEIRKLLQGISTYKKRILSDDFIRNLSLSLGLHKRDLKRIINLSIAMGYLTTISILTFPHAQSTRYPMDVGLSPKDYKRGLGVIDQEKEIIESLKFIVKVLTDELKRFH